MAIDAVRDDGEVTEDSLLDGRVRFLQPRRGYRAAIDPVLLAASVAAVDGARVLDLGCGAGAVALCLLARLPGLHVTGLEQAPEMQALAERNAALNQMSDRFTVLQGRVEVRPLPVPEGAFDLVTANPPYLGPERADAPPGTLKAAAHVEVDGSDFGDWVWAAARALRHKGRFQLVHRADRLADILAALDGPFGGIEVHPLFPKAGRDAKRVIVAARKGVRTPLTLSPGLVLHHMDGSYTAPVAAALSGAALDLPAKTT